MTRAVLVSPRKGERYVSVQNLAEMCPNLTGPKTEEPDTPAVVLELCEEHGITGQRYFDAQIVAVMKAHGITTLLTENAKDFACFDGIRVVDPFAP